MNFSSGRVDISVSFPLFPHALVSEGTYAFSAPLEIIKRIQWRSVSLLLLLSLCNIQIACSANLVNIKSFKEEYQFGQKHWEKAVKLSKVKFDFHVKFCCCNVFRVNQN